MRQMPQRLSGVQGDGKRTVCRPRKKQTGGKNRLRRSPDKRAGQGRGQPVPELQDLFGQLPRRGQSRTCGSAPQMVHHHPGRPWLLQGPSVQADRLAEMAHHPGGPAGRHQPETSSGYRTEKSGAAPVSPKIRCGTCFPFLDFQNGGTSRPWPCAAPRAVIRKSSPPRPV